MKYTFAAFFSLMDSLIEHGYTPIPFADTGKTISRPAIIRHDVDVDPIVASRFGCLEKDRGIRSTYFIMISSAYYNLLSRRNIDAVETILNCDHEIGLHFDMTNYDCKSVDEVINKISKEKGVLEEIFGITVKSLSWHIPVKSLVGKHLPQLDEIGLLNAYDPKYYNGYKYVSDSMMKWREPIEEYISMEQYEKLQILTHPIWYNDECAATDIEILKASCLGKIKDNVEYLDSIRPGFVDCFEALDYEN